MSVLTNNGHVLLILTSDPFLFTPAVNKNVFISSRDKQSRETSISHHVRSCEPTNESFQDIFQCLPAAIKWFVKKPQVAPKTRKLHFKTE